MNFFTCTLYLNKMLPKKPERIINEKSLKEINRNHENAISMKINKEYRADIISS